jgi:ectoine hydroxylase-related dioxygenase (phytanoyl-CoA dioxygenase family)
MSDYTFDKKNQAGIKESILEQGFAVVDNVFNQSFVKKIEEELLPAIDKESSFHGTKEHKDYAMLLACPIYGGGFIELLDNEDFWRPFNNILGSSCIVYVYTSSSMPPLCTNYSNRIHVDRPHYNPNLIDSLGCLICINDFTEENGATWLLPNSHNRTDTPSSEMFYKEAIRLKAKAGSVFYFNLRLWHAGGKNLTNAWRHSLGIGMIRPYLKQRIDLPNAIPPEFAEKMSDLAKQKLGYYAQPPKSLEEYYAPPEKRTYKEKSEWDNSI